MGEYRAMAKANPISIQFLMVVKRAVKGYTNILTENFESAKSIVLLTNEGFVGNYPIENREVESESESESLYVDLLITNIKELEKQKHIFEKPKAVYLETEIGELVKINDILECRIMEVAEHTEFDSVLYDPVTLEPLED